MDKSEFLRILRQVLEGELEYSQVEQNIKFYDEYISSKGKEMEESVLEELGDPRLIAKSIIDAKVNGQANGSEKGFGTHNYNDEEDTNQKINYKAFFPMRWYHKALFIGILIILAFFLLFVGRVILSLLFTVGFPLLILVFIIIILKNRK